MPLSEAIALSAVMCVELQLRCPGAGFPRRYCSAQCQQQHWLAGDAAWQQHKQACLQVKAARAAGVLQ
jgi:hypothetical protein